MRGMQAAAFIVGFLSKVAPLLLKALERRWSGSELRAHLAQLVNDDELRQAQATAKDVEDYLGGG